MVVKYSNKRTKKQKGWGKEPQEISSIKRKHKASKQKSSSKKKPVQEKQIETRILHRQSYLSLSRIDLPLLSRDLPPYYDFTRPGDYQRLVTDLNRNSPYPIQFQRQTNSAYGNFSDIEDDLLIAPVAMLKYSERSPKVMGVFAKRDFNIRGEVCLGEYIGELKDTEEINQIKHFNNDYAFELDKKTRDARNLRGWPAMVNATSSYQSANIVARASGDHIYYYAIRPIKAHEQLLIYYGDEYVFKDKRFLNPSDNWEESQDKFKKYQTFYKKRTTFDPALKELLGIDNTHFAIPDSESIQYCRHVDIPILMYQPNGRDFLPQNQHENITLLMYACWRGDIETAQKMLDIRANPNQQCSIRGYSSLHLIVLSPHLTLDQKKTLIELIIARAPEALKLQDVNENTILHHAIATGQTELVTFIIEKNNHITKHKPKLDIIECVNQDNLDVYVQAMSSHHLDMISTLVPLLSEMDIEEYLENPEEITKWLQHVQTEETPEKFSRRLTLIQQSLDPDLSRRAKTMFTRLINQLNPSHSLRETQPNKRKLTELPEPAPDPRAFKRITRAQQEAKTQEKKRNVSSNKLKKTQLFGADPKPFERITRSKQGTKAGTFFEKKSSNPKPSTRSKNNHTPRNS